MHDEANIEDRLRSIIVEHSGVPPDSIHSDSRFLQDMEDDSLDSVEMIIIIEDEFDIRIPDADAERIATFQDAVHYIMNKSIISP
ncbi:MAG: acyl carrier protein [Phycisphaerales bacterium]|jgi:acyl carrier protein|nr:acyl carrier protein [Phycisphaerales bacterium]